MKTEKGFPYQAFLRQKSGHKNEIIFSSCKYEDSILQIGFKIVTNPQKSPMI